MKNAQCLFRAQDKAAGLNIYSDVTCSPLRNMQKIEYAYMET